MTLDKGMKSGFYHEMEKLLVLFDFIIAAQTSDFL